MIDRIDLRLTPTQSKKLRVVVEARGGHRSKSDALRLLIDEEHERVTQARGETANTAPATSRRA